MLKGTFLERMYENEQEFPGGRGGAEQKPSVGGVWIFSGTTHLFICFVMSPMAWYSEHKPCFYCCLIKLTQCFELPASCHPCLGTLPYFLLPLQ